MPCNLFELWSAVVLEMIQDKGRLIGHRLWPIKWHRHQ